MELIGKEGTALTYLRPSGTAIFDEERLDVVSEGSFIAQGSTIKVVKVEGSRLVVREIKKKINYLGGSTLWNFKNYGLCCLWH